MKPPPEPDRLARRAEERRRRAAVARRRRYALLAVGAAAAVAGAAVGAGSDDEGDSPVTAAGAPECPDEVATSPRRLVGQMLIVRMESVATPALLRAVRRGDIGGVVLFPTAPVDERGLAQEIAALRRAAAAGGAPDPLVMIDQEGGEVKRLPDAPPLLTQGQLAEADQKTALREGMRTGRALSRLGIDVDLAPVLDLPGSEGAFIESRALGDSAQQVAEIGTKFAEGLQSAGVSATAKHFPGIGLATVNTDTAPSVIDVSRADLAPGLEPFTAAAWSPFDLVMISNATYPAYDAERPASLSPRLIEGLLRRTLGFQRVVITDDLGAGALTGAGIGEGQAAVGAARAGADLLLFALSDGAAARAALLRALRRGELDRAALVESCARTHLLRSSPIR